METIGQIVVRKMQEPSKGFSSSWGDNNNRKDTIQACLRRMFLSSGREPPAAAMIELMTDDALSLWKNIPTENLMSATEEAIIEAGAFTATAGLVAKCWRQKHGESTVPQPPREMIDRNGPRSSTVYKEKYWADVFHGTWEGDLKK